MEGLKVDICIGHVRAATKLQGHESYAQPFVVHSKMGTLAIGQLPENMAVKSEIPKNISQLINDAGYQNVSGVTSIVGGVVTTDYVEALGIKVAAANVTGKLVIGQLPDEAAKKSDIPTVPTSLSAFANDCGFQNASGVTSIIGGVVTTDFVEALGISVNAANIKGTLVVGQLPTEVAKKDDIPTDVDDLDGSDDLAKLSNMTTIVGGIVTTDFVNALGITVDAAQVNGVLKVGQLPSEVAKKTDIPTVPTSLSAFANDPGFQTATGVTNIVGGLITADYINALGISVNAANIKGTLAIGQLPSGTVTTSNVTSIVGGIVTTDYVNALGINVAAANITGTLAASQIDAASLSVSAAQITGLLTASQIDATRLSIAAGNITGTLAIGQLPDNLATTDDIPDVPTSLSDLRGYESDVTTIVEGVITTDYIYALGLTASELRGSQVTLFDDDGEEIGYISLSYYDRKETVDIYSYETLRLSAYREAVMMIGDYGDYVAVNEDGVSVRCDLYSVDAGSLGFDTMPWDTLYADSCSCCTSDENKKNSIEDLPDKYLVMFDNLHPYRFKMNNGKSGRYHPGYTAQDVKKAMDIAGIDSTEFGGWVEGTAEDGSKVYMLRYEEFGAIYAAKIKQLEARVAELEVEANG